MEAPPSTRRQGDRVVVSLGGDRYETTVKVLGLWDEDETARGFLDRMVDEGRARVTRA